MYMVGQPPRLSGQAERLPYNVGSWLPDYFFGLLQTFRRKLTRPRDHNPVWNFQERQNLCGNLNQEPANNRVRDRDFINIAPLQLSEEIVDLHEADIEKPLRARDFTTRRRTPRAIDHAGRSLGGRHEAYTETSTPAGVARLSLL
jgi:hypothetical protein